MSDGPATPNPQKDSSKTFLMLGIMLIVLLLLSWPIKKYLFDRPPKPSVPEIVDVDPICQYIQKLQLNCVVTPVAEGVLGPGHFVAYSTVAVPHTKVPFSNGDLFAEACAVPGAKAAEMRAQMLTELKKQEQENNLPFDEITYKIDRNFQAGADLPVPRLADLKLKAGPKMTEVQDISLKVPHGWLKIIDENQFINLLAGAAIKQRCIDHVIEKEYSVVSKAAIAQDYDIVVTEKAGQSFDLSAAVTKGDITMDAGGDAGSAVDETIKKNSAIPVVVGVGFFDSEIFRENRARLVSPILSTTSAQTSALAAAMTPSGLRLWRVEGTATLGKPVSLQHSGSTLLGGGDPRCGPSVQPSAALTSVFAPAKQPAERPESRSFEFLTSGTIAGGLSKRWEDFRCQDEPGLVEADVSFESVVEMIVRSDNTATLQVEFTGVPIGQAEVRDWTGRLLTQSPHETGEKDGSLKFPLAGAGVYEMRISGARHLSAGGASTRPVDERGTFTVSVR